MPGDGGQLSAIRDFDWPVLNDSPIVLGGLVRWQSRAPHKSLLHTLSTLMLSHWVVCKGPWDVFKGSLAVVLGPPTSHTCCWEFLAYFFHLLLLLFIFYLSFLLVHNFPTDHQIIYRTKPSGNKNPVTAAIDIEDKTVLKHFLQSLHAPSHQHVQTGIIAFVSTSREAGKLETVWHYCNLLVLPILR